MPPLNTITSFGSGSLAAPWTNVSNAFYGGTGAISVTTEGVLTLGTSASSAVRVTSGNYSMAVGDSFVLGPVDCPDNGIVTMELRSNGTLPYLRLTINRDGGDIVQGYYSESGASSVVGFNPATHRYFRYKLIADGGANAQTWRLQHAASDPHLEASWTTRLEITNGNLTLSNLTPFLLFAVGTAATPATVAAVNPAAPADTTAPAVASAEVLADGVTLRVTYTETDSPPMLPASDVTGMTFTVGGTTRSITSSTRSSDLVHDFTLATPVYVGDTVLRSYQSGGGNVTDSAATPNALVSFTDQPVTNSSTQTPAGDTTAPTVATAEVLADGLTLRLTYTETDSPPMLPASDVTGMSFNVNGTARSITSSTRSSDLVHDFTLASVVYTTDTVTRSYVSASGNVTDSAGTPNALASFTDVAVTNSSTQTAASGGDADRIEWHTQPPASVDQRERLSTTVKAVNGAGGLTDTALSEGQVALYYDPATAPAAADTAAPIEVRTWESGVARFNPVAEHDGAGVRLVAKAVTDDLPAVSGGPKAGGSAYVFHGNEVDLFLDCDPGSDGVLRQVYINWGDGSPLEFCAGSMIGSLRPMEWMRHSYKSSGWKTIGITAQDFNDRTHTVSRLVFISIGSSVGADVPWGRFPNPNGRDQYPGIHPSLLTCGQPHEYVDTTYPEPQAGLIRYATNLTELTTAYNELGVTGGHIYCTWLVLTGAVDANRWVVPARPLDGNGVAYDTTIVIEADPATRHAQCPAPGTRITPAIGETLPHFRSWAAGSSGEGLDLNVNGQYVYGLRFVLMALSVDPTSAYYGESNQSGGGLSYMHQLNHHITFDRCYSYLPPEETWKGGCRRDFYAKGSYIAWVDGWHWGNRDINTDSQAIAIWDGHGPFKVVNCFLGPLGENFMLGGAQPSENTNPKMPFVPRDTEFRRNHCWRSGEFNPSNTRYYTTGGRILTNGAAVLAHNTGGKTITFAAPLPAQPGTTAGWPSPGHRVDYVLECISGKGAGQTGRASGFPSTTLMQVSSGFEETPLDNTSVVRIRWKTAWINKNNGELKTGRGNLWTENIFENGAMGDGQQYFHVIFKSSGDTGSWPSVKDVVMMDSMLLNTFGGISCSPQGVPGDPFSRFHLENLLMISARDGRVGTANFNQHVGMFLLADHGFIKGVTMLDYPYALIRWDAAEGDSNLPERIPTHPGNGPTNKVDYLTMTGILANQSSGFSQKSGVSLKTFVSEGNGLLGGAGLPTGNTAAPDNNRGWTHQPGDALDWTQFFVNPDKTDLWGAADFSLRPELTTLIAATPNRLDWPRLQQRTAGVRADESIIPFEWDD